MVTSPHPTVNLTESAEKVSAFAMSSRHQPASTRPCYQTVSQRRLSDEHASHEPGAFIRGRHQLCEIALAVASRPNPGLLLARKLAEPALATSPPHVSVSVVWGPVYTLQASAARAKPPP